MDKALRTIGSVLRHRTTLFLISDFLDEHFGRALRLVSLRHDVVAVSVQDPVEATLPELGWLVCEDAETGDLVELHTSDPRCRHAFEVERLARTATLQETFRRPGSTRCIVKLAGPPKGAAAAPGSPAIASGFGQICRCMNSTNLIEDLRLLSPRLTYRAWWAVAVLSTRSRGRSRGDPDMAPAFACQHGPGDGAGAPSWDLALVELER